MVQKLEKRQKGFTIIEVMIVLAIAGLILLIVFLAVPALQRSSRNTRRRSDISAILGAVSEYTNNNGGSLPAASGNFNTQFANANPTLGYYTIAANVKWVYQTSATAVADPASGDKVTVANYAKCSGNAAVAAGANARTVVAVYDAEGSGGSLVPQCVESGS